ncbi:MAG: chromate efflux transporter [Dehalococcoidia bacterium]|nr:chromate efflux transporter [Dehalococcoidia bacterium]
MQPSRRSSLSRVAEVLFVATRLGLTSFGGPIAHLGYYREEYVNRRKWLDEATYADLVALCQFLPGPASSQVHIAIGITRAGLLGGLAAWLGFTIPSAVAMILFAYGVNAVGDVTGSGWLHGLLVVAVAVVALAVWSMARSLCPDRPRITLAVLAAVAMLFWHSAIAQVGVIALGGLLGWLLLRGGEAAPAPAHRIPVGRGVAVACLVVFGALLVGLPLLRHAFPSQPLDVFDSFYRVGSLVFGGGHVVLPLLQAEVVPPGWVTTDQFLAGYGAAQAVPGPLFTFSAYLGATMTGMPAPWLGGVIALGAIFLPSFLLVVGALPFWDSLRAIATFRRALMGVNAAVVGLLLAALYDPVWTSAIHAPKDFALGLAAFALLAFWRLPPWLVVVLAALGGAGLALL